MRSVGEGEEKKGGERGGAGPAGARAKEQPPSCACAAAL